MLLRAMLIASAMFVVGSSANAATLDVTIENVKVGKGQVIVCVWKSAAGFPDCDKHIPLQKKKLQARSATLTVSFDDIPDGTYAVGVAQDLNGNDRVDANFLGIPKEPVAVSNDAKGTLGAPKFGAASFELSKTRAITIHL